MSFFVKDLYGLFAGFLLWYFLGIRLGGLPSGLVLFLYCVLYFFIFGL